MKTERGFTLLEVMVALAVFALLASAVLIACQFVLRQSSGAQERLFAQWVADNQLSELRLQLPPVGRQHFIRQFAGESWRVDQRVSREGQSGLLNVELELQRGSDSAALHQVTGWIALPEQVPVDE